MRAGARGRRLLFAALAVMAVVTAAGLLGGVASPAGAARAGDPAPEYSARLLGSEATVALADLRGEVVLLNTWATWCAPCREELPDFEAFYQRHRSDGLRLVGVNIDEGRSDGTVSRYVERAGITFPVWRDPSNRFGKTFRVLGPPETFLIDRDGKLLYHWRGQMDPEEPANRSRILGALHGENTAGAAAASAVAGAGLLVAFGAGLVSVLSPCVLPLIPSYASVIAGVSMRRERRPSRPLRQPAMVGAPGADPATVPVAPAARRTALTAGITFVAGFSAVFMALGVLVNRAGAALADHRVWLSRAGGVVLLVLGLHLLGLLRIGAADREVRMLKFATPTGHPGVFLVGVAFAAGWSPCVGPVLAGILTMAAAGGSTVDAAGLLAAYCAGLAVPFLAAALALDRFLAWSSRLRRSWLPVAERVSGAFVLAVGLLLVTGLFTRLASWLA